MQCTTCNNHFPENNFTFRNRSEGIRRKTCNNCRNAQQRARYYRNHEASKALGRKRRHRSYYKDHEATLAKNQAYAKANARILRNKKLRHVYGITVDDYEAMLTAQNNACAICQTASKSLHIDHEHSENYASLPPEEKRLRVRGLVCRSCNTSKIGSNDLESALKIVAYLLSHYQIKTKASVVK